MNRNNRILWVILLLILPAVAACQTDEPEPTPTPTPTPAPAVGAVTSEPAPATVDCQVEPPAGWNRVTALPGDTLGGLAERHGTSVEEIRQVNCIESNLIVAGERLYLPPAVCTVSPPAGWELYIVGTGDTLADLAAGRNTSAATVIEVNCLSQSAALDIGQTLYLPALPTPTPTITPLPTFTPQPPPPPPTLRPTPTLPLVTPTPGIVSISTPALGQTDNQLAQANAPGQTNAPGQANAPGQQPGVGSPGGGTGGSPSPGLTRAGPAPAAISRFFLPGGYYQSSTNGQPFCVDSISAATTVPTVTVSLKTGTGSLCLNNFPFGQVFSVTISSNTDNTRMVGVFRVDAPPDFAGPGRQPSGRIPDLIAGEPTPDFGPYMESKDYARWLQPNLDIYSTSAETWLNAGNQITKIQTDFSWPADLPAGGYTVSAVAQQGQMATTNAIFTEPIAPAISVAGVAGGPIPGQYYLRPGDYQSLYGPFCPYLTPEEVATGSVEVVGRRFPPTTPVGFDVYQPTVSLPEDPDYGTPHAPIPDKRQEQSSDAQGGVSVNINLSGLSVNKDYVVVARWPGDEALQENDNYPAVMTCFTLPPNPSP